MPVRLSSRNRYSHPFRNVVALSMTVTAVVCACAVCAFARPRQSSRTSAARATRRSGGAGVVILNDSVTILETPNESGSIQLAAKDLASDFKKVFGQRPRIITQRVQAARTAILIGQASQIPASMRPAGLSAPESFSISVHKADWNGRPISVILLAGADMRGTIYAIYEFSQEYLGVDPMYYWTDNAPLRRASIEIPATLNRDFSPPVFKYRGFFINDEDLLTGWAPGEETDHTGIALAVWNKVYETILRLKGNMVAPGTWIFPDDPQVKLAAKRGLIITQHHAIPLGLNVARWPKDVPYNYTAHPEILERAWKDAVNSYLPNQEVLWTVGLRGLSDVTYASMDPSVRGNDKALGALITKAIANQIRIVRSVRPNAQFITSLWQEGSGLVRQGDLRIPPEVSAVWADDGYGYLQDHGEVAAGQGAYDHIAMMNGPCEPAYGNGPDRAQFFGDWALYQSRRDKVFSREHERHSAGHNVCASRDGCGMEGNSERSRSCGQILSPMGLGGVREESGAETGRPIQTGFRRAGASRESSSRIRRSALSHGSSPDGVEIHDRLAAIRVAEPIAEMGGAAYFHLSVWWRRGAPAGQTVARRNDETRDSAMR